MASDWQNRAGSSRAGVDRAARSAGDRVHNAIGAFLDPGAIKAAVKNIGQSKSKRKRK